MSTNPGLNLFLCGDVMTGRGIDQSLPHPGNPVLHEPCVTDARDYVKLAERLNGPFPRPVSFKYIWGDALSELSNSGADLRIINLETSITTSDDFWSDKGIHYRMNPHNIGCLLAARVSGCCLANNHVLDWGYSGLAETLQTLDAAGIAHSGAGRNAAEAAAPAIFDLAGKGRVLLFSFGLNTSGIPGDWAATDLTPGVSLLKNLSETSVQEIVTLTRQFQKPGDLVIVSIHWGGNWGHEISKQQITFAHRLIEEGIALVHGHSSHHAKAIEVYQNHLILYGCGDFLTDYEGIGGHEEFRGDLALMHLLQLAPQQGTLVSARLVAMQQRCFRLQRASAADATWLCSLLNHQSAQFATRFLLLKDNSALLQW